MVFVFNHIDGFRSRHLNPLQMAGEILAKIKAILAVD